MTKFDLRAVALSASVLALMGTAACTKKSESAPPPPPAAETTSTEMTVTASEPMLSASIVASSPETDEVKSKSIKFSGKDLTNEFNFLVTQTVNSEVVQTSTVTTKVNDVEYTLTVRCETYLTCEEAYGLLTRVKGEEKKHYVFKFMLPSESATEFRVEKSKATEMTDLPSAVLEINKPETPAQPANSGDGTPVAPGAGER